VESPFLTAEWRDLVLLNYEIDPEILAKRAPPGTELDAWRGRTLVSVVGFRFLRTRVLGLPIPLHRNFDEVNLRFYVRRTVPDGVRRGVVFVKEIVPRRAIAWVARSSFNENYVALPMRHEVSLPGCATYQWRFRGRWNGLAAQVASAPRLPAPDSEAEFLTEHYWGYALQRDGATLEYRVEHAPWRSWRAATAALDCDVAGLYGPQLAPFLSRSPCSAFVAEGSPVLVRRGLRLS
jgi:uncharacterized protein YqjF (DUF2071 family)